MRGAATRKSGIGSSLSPPRRQPKVRDKTKAVSKPDVEDEPAKRRPMPKEKTGSFVLRQIIDKEDADAADREVASWRDMQGAGTTYYQHRLDHRVVDYRADVALYHNMVPILDFPIQAINPSLHTTRPHVTIDLLSFKTSIGKIVVELFVDEVSYRGPRCTR